MLSGRPLLAGVMFIALAAIAWALAPAEPATLGILAGGVTGLLNLLMLLVRSYQATERVKGAAVRMVHRSFAARAALILVVLLVLREPLGETGVVWFLVGFFALEALVLIGVARKT